MRNDTGKSLTTSIKPCPSAAIISGLGIFPTALKIHQRGRLKRRTHTRALSLCLISMVCLKYSAEKIRATGVTVHLKLINTIHSMLGTPKVKPDKLDKSGVVYNIQCEDCPSKYVGETERSLVKTFTEHKHASSPVSSHMTDCGHKFDPNNVKILDFDHRF